MSYNYMHDPFDFYYEMSFPIDYYSGTSLPIPRNRLFFPPQAIVTPKRVANQKKAEQFEVKLCVKQFKPAELEVKTVGNCVVVRGKHEERSDPHGLVSRDFTRRYELPDDVEPETVTSSLSPDGTLTIVASRKVNERVVPIIPPLLELRARLARKNRELARERLAQEKRDQERIKNMFGPWDIPVTRQ